MNKASVIPQFRLYLGEDGDDLLVDYEANIRPNLSNIQDKQLRSPSPADEKMRSNEIKSREECTICLESFTNSRPGIVTTCNHRFHKKCISQWQDGSQCPVCKRAISIKDAASHGRKKRQSVENTAGTSEEPRSSTTKATPGSSKRKEAPETTLRRSARNKVDTSGGKKGGLKGKKTSTYEEEELKYVPDWDVCTTDNPFEDPRVAQNLAEGLVLPFKAAELAEMPNDFLIQGTYMHCVTALNFVSTSLKRAAEMNESEESLKDEILEKDACITELKKQLESAEARATTADSRAEEIEAAAAREHAKFLSVSKKDIAQKDASISTLRKELESVHARAMAAEAALKNIENEVKLKVDEATSKAVDEFKSSQQYKDALVDYAFSSFNEVYSIMKKRAG